MRFTILEKIDRLEDARMKLDYVDGTLKMLIATFENSGAFSYMNPTDVERALTGLNVHVDYIGQEIDSIIASLMKSSASVDVEDIPEIINRMHEITHKNDCTDISFFELNYFRDKALSARNDGNLTEVLWDLYLFGVYKGMYEIGKEGRDTEQHKGETPF